jgi:magnesium-transporting ATPase (P-type)
MATMHLMPGSLYSKLVGMSVALSDEIVKVVFLKGAPEKVIQFCVGLMEAQDSVSSHVKDNRSNNSVYWLTKATEMASRGMRVIGVAHQIVPNNFELSIENLSDYNKFGTGDNMCMHALLGIIDPPRPDAIVAIKDAQDAHIVVKMITGDHPVTALAIAKTIGLNHRNRAVSGVELNEACALSEDAFDQLVLENDVFARTTPEHKLRIVQSLQRQGCICSMTGDGVNDAPALKAANIGVAMGITGTDVAKDASSMIILDDNFATIVAAIRLGRCTYDNLIKILNFVLPTNGGQAFSITCALIIGVDIPITALQILWVNTVTSVTLGLVLAFEKPREDIMRKMPRNPKKQIFDRFLMWRLLFVSLIVTFSVLGIYHWELERIKSKKLLRTIAVNTVFSCQIGYIFACRNLKYNSTLGELFSGNPIIWVGTIFAASFQVLFTYAAPFQYVFHTEPMDGISWGKVVIFGLVTLICVEFEKARSSSNKQLLPPMVLQSKQEASKVSTIDEDIEAGQL